MKRLYRPDYRTSSGRYVYIAGFFPFNWYVWNRHTGTRPWTAEECGDTSLLRHRLRLLHTHVRWARIRRTLVVR